MCLRYYLWRLRNSDVVLMAGEKPLGRILFNVPVSDGVQVATLNLGDYLFSVYGMCSERCFGFISFIRISR